MPIGVIKLLVTLWTAPRLFNLMINFLVVKVPSTYNVILGRPFIRMVMAILSIYHLIMKLSMEEGIGEVKGNQLMDKECYCTIVREKQKAKEMFTMSSNNLAEQKKNKIEATKGIMKVKIDE